MKKIKNIKLKDSMIISVEEMKTIVGASGINYWYCYCEELPSSGVYISYKEGEPINNWYEDAGLICAGTTKCHKA